ncbi:response regulator transcription factor [Kordiimonas sp. SCSIO 12603]|uniref:winged helix-turn-helix domain-containing protein n=1 Tax=Kordiimonas sp. SCSIO 12603 TaxID=2829596 RepID=UPI0021044A2C|nr:response regulator transcription factor [Kordiimonas sp. SCSIO 12603]UTW59453.1 response regulator transcription factor [Kordiimonas sp. SCSIO 12603]
MHLLLIEDDPSVAEYLIKGLRELGHSIDHVSNGRDGLTLAMDQKYDILIVDRMLPELDGLSIIKALRAVDNKVPILILSALADVDERVKGLKSGGDDYLVKPFAFSELTARLEVLMRRSEPLSSNLENSRLTIGDLEMNLLTREVTRAGRKIDLKTREFTLLEQLLKNPDRVQTRTMLLENVWGYNFTTNTNVIDVHMSNLRKKIDHGFGHPLLHTVRGIGYKVSNNVE